MGKIDIETRKRTCLHVTQADLVEGFRRVGVQRGDILYCHSSLSRFGYVEGGAEAIVDALLEAVGPDGTVAMPRELTRWERMEPFSTCGTRLRNWELSRKRFASAPPIAAIISPSPFVPWVDMQKS